MDMFRNLSLLGLAAFMLANCAQQTSFDEQNIPSIDLLATHAFQTQEQVDEVTYIANDVAPWLGRILLRTQAGALLSTDIEGQSHQTVAKTGFTHMTGIFRPKAPGVFLAITEAGSMTAFMESDDQGGFSQMLYSGETLMPEQFCPQTDSFEHGVANSALLLTEAGKFVVLSFVTEGNVIEQTVQKTIPAPPDILTCVTQGEDIYALSKKGEQTLLHHYNGIKWRKQNVPAGVRTLAPLPSADSPLLIASTDTGIFIIDGVSLDILFKINVIDGLSIRGLTQAQTIWATSANFGGAAFRNGFVGFLDAQEQRLVFISSDYMALQIKMRQTAQ